MADGSSGEACHLLMSCHNNMLDFEVQEESLPEAYGPDTMPTSPEGAHNATKKKRSHHNEISWRDVMTKSH